MFNADIFYSTLNYPYRLNFFFAENYFIGLEFAVFIFACFFLFYKISSSIKISAIHAIAVFLMTFAVNDFDFVGWRACFFPLFILSFYGPSWLLPIATLFWVYTASGLGVFGFLLTLIFTKRKIEPLVLLSLAIAIFTGFPLSPLPDYPGDAYLQPLGAIYGGKTLFAYEHFFKFIDQKSMFENIFRAAVIFIGLLFLWLLSFRPKNILENRLVPAAIVLSLLVFCGEMAKLDYMPYRFFYRLIPGIAVLPFVWDLSLIFNVLIIALCLKYCKVNDSKLSVALFLPASLAAIYIMPPLVKPEILSKDASFTEQVKKSPSAFVLSYWGDFILGTKDKSYTLFVPGVDYKFTAHASQRNDLINNIFDRNLSTRWTSGQTQRGDEYLEIKLDRELEISRINLSGGNHYSDFPRGLKLEVLTESGNREVVFEKINWLGPVRFTAKGYPYFGPQGVVELTLPKPVKISSLVLSQLGKDPNFNWSIAELELFK